MACSDIHQQPWGSHFRRVLRHLSSELLFLFVPSSSARNLKMHGCLQIKQITADITPILNTFSQGILQNPAASSVLTQLASNPEITAFVNQVQTLANMLSPNIQGLLVNISIDISAMLTYTYIDVASVPAHMCS